LAGGFGGVLPRWAPTPPPLLLLPPPCPLLLLLARFPRRLISAPLLLLALYPLSFLGLALSGFLRPVLLAFGGFLALLEGARLGFEARLRRGVGGPVGLLGELAPAPRQLLRLEPRLLRLAPPRELGVRRRQL